MAHHTTARGALLLVCLVPAALVAATFVSIEDNVVRVLPPAEVAAHLSALIKLPFDGVTVSDLPDARPTQPGSGDMCGYSCLSSLAVNVATDGVGVFTLDMM